MLIGVYGPNAASRCYSFWEELYHVRSTWSGPWIIGGDFNVIRFGAGKSNGSRTTRSMHDFGTFVINSLEMWESPLTNGRFTWTNGQDNPIVSRLDRFLVCLDWEEWYSHFFQGVQTRLTSDHWPIDLNISMINYGPKPFRFENMWVLHSSFKFVVEAWWKGCEVHGKEG